MNISDDYDFLKEKSRRKKVGGADFAQNGKFCPVAWIQLSFLDVLTSSLNESLLQ